MVISFVISGSMNVGNEPRSAADEVQDVDVEAFGLGLGESVLAAGVELEDRIRDDLGGQTSRSLDRGNLVVVAVNDQGRS